MYMASYVEGQVDRRKQKSHKVISIGLVDDNTQYCVWPSRLLLCSRL